MTHSYPTSLESWWLERACRFSRTKDQPAAIKRLAPAVVRLSDLFTRARDAEFGQYTQNEELLLAYGLFAFPQTYQRLHLVLQELTFLKAFENWSSESELRITDLGCGSGAASSAALATLSTLFPDKPIFLNAIDQSPAALNLCHYLLKDCAMNLWPRAMWRIQEQSLGASQRLERSAKKQHLMLCSFALGEIFYESTPEIAANWLDEQKSSLTDQGLLILLEPALQETSTRLMSVRDLLLAKGWSVLAPCPHQLACPMLREGKVWCHEVRKWSLPPTLQRINNHLKRTLQELKFSFLVLRPPGTPRPNSLSYSRLVAPLAKVKGRSVTRACAPQGELEEIEIQERTIKATGRRHLEKFHRGDLIQTNDALELNRPHSLRLPTPESLQLIFTPTGPSTTDPNTLAQTTSP